MSLSNINHSQRPKMNGIQDENSRITRSKVSTLVKNRQLSSNNINEDKKRLALVDLSNVREQSSLMKDTASSQARKALTTKSTKSTKPTNKPLFSTSVIKSSVTSRLTAQTNFSRQSTQAALNRNGTTFNLSNIPQRALRIGGEKPDSNIPVFKSFELDVQRKRPTVEQNENVPLRDLEKYGRSLDSLNEGPQAKKFKIEPEAPRPVRKPMEVSKLPTFKEHDHDDLDADDIDDPMMVAEYSDDIFKHLYSLEESYLPNGNYMKDQKNLTWQTRSVLIDWLVEVHQKLRLLPETLFFAVNIIDRFMSRRVVALNKVQLVGITALLIATKYEEVYTPALSNFVYVVDGQYPEDEILRAERFILQVLRFELSYPNAMNFLRRISKADDYDLHSRTFGKYLCEIALLDHRFVGIKHSLVAAAAMHISRMVLGRYEWDRNLIHYSGEYSLDELKPVCKMMFEYLVSDVEHEGFFKKYASKKFLNASLLTREWALSVRRDIQDGMRSPKTNLFI